MSRAALAATIAIACFTNKMPAFADEPGATSNLTIEWKNRYLTIHGKHIPGGKIAIHYLEAYCRPGSTDRDWGKTVIRHRSRQVSANKEKTEIKLRDELTDGVVVDHVITAKGDEVDFRVTAHNPTDKESEAHWAQPCVRVDQFTGAGKKDAWDLVPKYARKSFVFIDGKQTRFPTEPWAKKARYTPGQVYCPRGVDRNDVNPRPLSTLVPSNGLIGCYSVDEKLILANAWEPYQELFQGVAACLHSDFRIGGLKPGETKKIRGKVYIVSGDVGKLVERYKRDFSEHTR